MSKHLFENFLEDRRVYGLNRSYWERLLKKSVPNTENWLINEFANGQKIYDGNPMYALLLKNGKALRIIQEEPENSEPYITAWVKETEDLKSNLIQELVITLELSGMTKKIALELISLWSKDSTDTSAMNSFITEKLTNLKAA